MSEPRFHLTSVDDLRWSNAEHTAIDCVATFEETGPVPFTARADDAEEHGRALFLLAVNGEWGAIAAYDGPPEPGVVFRLYKTTIISRMTDEELDAFDIAMASAPRRQRLMWEGCLSVESTSPFFPVLQASLEEAFGEDRAAAILAPE